jgi:hypothetical protein
VHIYFVLDRSGWMQSIAPDVMGGFNAFLVAQQADGSDALLTLVQFDSQDPHEVLVDAAAIQSAPPLTSASFVPRGGTRLYDAMGHIIADATIRAERRRIENEPEEAHPTRIRWRGPTAGQTASRRCNCRRGHAE